MVNTQRLICFFRTLVFQFLFFYATFQTTIGKRCWILPRCFP